MAFIRKKMKNGNPYYYIVESYRDGKKVRQRTLEYIGPADKLAEYALKGWQSGKDAGSPSVSAANLTFRSYLHGSAMAMFYMAKRIGVEPIMDRHFSPKTVKGLPRSRVLLLAMIHRAIDPGSKRSFPAWAKETSLPYYLKFNAEDLDSAAFWEAMDGISEDEIIAAQREIVDRIVAMTGIDLKTFHLDYTNYFTFIDSKNNRCVICKRGHNKQKRDDLRQYSLAMLTSYALQIPIIWELYEGNKNDKSEFSDFAKLIEKELKAHNIKNEEVTITFDGGSNSEENFKDFPFHFICSHSMTGMKELYDIDLSEYSEVHYGDEHVKLAYRIDNLSFSGIVGTGILTHSQALEDGQTAELARDLKAIQELGDEVNERLKNSASRIYTELQKRRDNTDTAIRKAEEYNASVKESNSRGTGRKKKERQVPVWDEKAELTSIVEKMIYKGRKYIREFTTISVFKNAGDIWQIQFLVDENKKNSYCRKYYGKKLTCTDRKDWSTEQILKEYGEQECIETNIFRVSKDTDHFSVRPQYHWTDDKIRVHTFICLWAMIISEMLKIEFEKDDMKMTKAAMLDKLSTIRDGWLFENDKKVKRVLEHMNGEQQQIWATVQKLAT